MQVLIETNQIKQIKVIFSHFKLWVAVAIGSEIDVDQATRSKADQR